MDSDSTTETPTSDHAHHQGGAELACTCPFPRLSCPRCGRRSLCVVCALAATAPAIGVGK